MPCFLKKSDKPDYTSSTVTLMTTKHTIRETIGGSAEWKKRRQDSCEYLEMCHVLRGSRCVSESESAEGRARGIPC